jgi:hypothetical protein
MLHPIKLNDQPPSSMPFFHPPSPLYHHHHCLHTCHHYSHTLSTIMTTLKQADWTECVPKQWQLSFGDVAPCLHHDNDDRDGMANNKQQGEEHDDGHHHSTENHHCEQLLVGWKQVTLQNGETTSILPSMLSTTATTTPSLASKQSPAPQK